MSIYARMVDRRVIPSRKRMLARILGRAEAFRKDVYGKGEIVYFAYCSFMVILLTIHMVGTNF